MCVSNGIHIGERKEMHALL